MPQKRRDDEYCIAQILPHCIFRLSSSIFRIACAKELGTYPSIALWCRAVSYMWSTSKRRMNRIQELSRYKLLALRTIRLRGRMSDQPSATGAVEGDHSEE